MGPLYALWFCGFGLMGCRCIRVQWNGKLLELHGYVAVEDIAGAIAHELGHMISGNYNATYNDEYQALKKQLDYYDNQAVGPVSGRVRSELDRRITLCLFHRPGCIN